MGNAARLTGGARRQLLDCLNGIYPCKICVRRGVKTPSAAAVDAWDGYKPICERHALEAEKYGYKIVRKEAR